MAFLRKVNTISGAEKRCLVRCITRRRVNVDIIKLQLVREIPQNGIESLQLVRFPEATMLLTLLCLFLRIRLADFEIG